MDHQRLGQELVRALRGKRSQPALSRRLGYRSNVVYCWEHGRREPAASELFRIVAKTGGDPAKAFARFPVRLEGVDLTTAEGVAALLAELRGEARIVRVAERCGVSRYTASRWLRGLSEPKLSQLLMLIEVLTLRVVDFVCALVPASEVPSIAAAHQELAARRRVAFDHPWSQAVLRVLETKEYRSRDHRAGWIAKKLGIDLDEEVRSLAALREAGLVRWEGRRYECEAAAVDTSMATLAERQRLKRHWADLGRARIDAGADGLYSWSVISLSEADYERLQAMHVRYMQAMRQLVEQSDTPEVVAVANVQLFAFDG